MSCTVRFLPLYGANISEPLCFLLQLDDCKILLDVGWTESFDASLLEPLKEVASQVDVVLLSHPDISHLGALPYACGKLGLKAIAYCTEPVRKLGTMVMYDLHQSLSSSSEFDLFDLDDVDKAFENTISLKYSEPQALGDNGTGITITPFAAGHLLGGTIWKISKDSEEIVYAVDYNHRNERLLDACQLHTLTRPTLLITDSTNALTTEPRTKLRDAKMTEHIVRTLGRGGSVLMPVDSAGRVLELILFLEIHLKHNPVAFPFVFLSSVAFHTVNLCKSYLEWMGDTVSKLFENSRENPFILKTIKICHGLEELESFPGPKVVMAPSSSLENGFARTLFVSMAENPLNLLLFTLPAAAGSLAAALTVAEGAPSSVELEVSQKVPLQGEELEEYLREKSEKGQQEPPALGMEEDSQKGETERGASGAQVGDRESAPGDPGDKVLDLVSLLERPVLVEGFTATSAQFPVFPLAGSKPEWDEYGEIIDTAQFGAGREDMQGTEGMQAEEEAMAEDAEAAELFSEPPSKVVVNKVNVSVRSEVLSLDYDGKSDGRSVKTILRQILPQKLILVHGSAEATEHLRVFARQQVTLSVHAPQKGEVVNVTSGLAAYRVVLTDELLQSVTFRKVGEYEVAWVDGLAGTVVNQAVPLGPISVPGPHRMVFVGDLKLSDFKSFLRTQGIQAEFGPGGGYLRCGNTVSLRKTEDQGILVEGTLSEEYFKIRELVYSRFNVM